MRTNLIVFITCHEMDLRDFRAFERCAEFSRYEALITLTVVDTRQEMVFQCSADGAMPYCWGWRYFREQWIRKYGPI